MFAERELKFPSLCAETLHVLSICDSHKGSQVPVKKWRKVALALKKEAVFVGSYRTPS
jgi:hypothetical protein